MKALLVLFKGVIYPEKTFNEIKENPRAVLYFVWIVLLNIVLFVLASKITFPIVKSGLLERASELPPEMREKVLESYTFTKFLIGGLFGVIIVIPIKLLIQGLIFYILFPLAGGVIGWGRALTAVIFANFVSFIANLFKLPFVAALKVQSVHTDLSIIYGGESVFMKKLLGQIDIFTLYSLFVLGVGLSVLGEGDRKRALLFVYFLWLFWIVVYSLIPVPKGGVFL